MERVVHSLDGKGGGGGACAGTSGNNVTDDGISNDIDIRFFDQKEPVND
jgi:hypothetical protein